MERPEWYVVQVQTGREAATCAAILRVCQQADAASDTDEPLVSEVFAPSYRSQFKRHGAWHSEERMLLPGYVVAVTAHPWELARVMRNVAGFTRILVAGETFAPLSEDDRSWIEQWTKEGDRSIPMSIAYKEGDRIVVTEGPLKGHEAMITRVNRRQSLAHLEIHAGVLTIRTTVGLGILPKGEQSAEPKARPERGA